MQWTFNDLDDRIYWMEPIGEFAALHSAGSGLLSNSMSIIRTSLLLNVVDSSLNLYNARKRLRIDSADNFVQSILDMADWILGASQWA